MNPSPNQVEAHWESIRALSKPGGPLAPDSPYSTIRNQHWFAQSSAGAIVRKGRRALWTQILSRAKQDASQVPHDRKAIVLAGPPGAGKSTIIHNVLGAGLKSYLIIDSDDFKHQLLGQAVEDGTYESEIKPPQVFDLEQAGEMFFPLELASLTHEESARLAVELTRQALNIGVNVIHDRVLSWPQGAIQLGNVLEQAG
ncbi:MAG: zeta toxin family protein, partial [Bifidobacteriaceae bacterium]|nr:zeta toxin family protein [Bifidobacteriaceae bacterium]